MQQEEGGKAAICEKKPKIDMVRLGRYLIKSSVRKYKEFQSLVTNYETDLHIIPRSLKELKKVLSTIRAIQSATVDMELRYRELLKRYAVMRAYNIEVNEDEITALEGYWKRWQILWLHEIKVVNRRMDPIRKNIEAKQT